MARRRHVQVSSRARADWWSSSRALLPRDLVVRRFDAPTPSWDLLRDELNPYVHPVRSLFTPLAVPPAKRVVSPRGLLASEMHRVAFARPDLTWTCVRRKIRREVLYALGLAGRGSGGTHRHYRRTVTSEISC